VGSGHITDHQLAVALANLFAGRTVVGLGDGRGLYRELILNTGKVESYDAYDGSPNINNITHGKVIWRRFNGFLVFIFCYCIFLSCTLAL